MAIRFVALVILSAACLWAAPAHARYICDQFSLLQSDQLRLENTARELLGRRGIERGTEWYCRGPRGASARFETRHVRTAGGSTRWAEVYCIRQQGPWTCDATERRAVKVEIPLGDERLTITSRVPLDMEASTARTIVAKAFELAQSSAPTPPCHDLDRATTVIRDRLIRQFSADDDRIQLDVAGSELWLTTSSIVLDLREIRVGVSPSYELRCWSVPIIVMG